MTPPAVAPGWAAVPVAVAALGLGVLVVAVLEEALGAVVAGRWPGVRAVATRPVRRARQLVGRHPTRTERPDAVLWALAPAAYAGLAALALSVIPFAEGFAVADVRTGIVVFGAAEALLFVAVYLHGWSANAVFPLVGAYRYVAVGFSFMLVSMFVLIGVALPAESLSVGAVVESQRSMWNVLRQPLGLPLFAVVVLGAAFWGPLDVADGEDIGGGTAAEVSGPQLLAWAVARRCVLVTWSAMAAAAFLGGWLPPPLPGATLVPGVVWLAAKTLVVIGTLIAAGHVLPRVRPARFVTIAWVVLLPLSFLDLVIAGLGAL